MDYASNWWRPAPAQASPLGLAEKYGDKARSSAPSGNDATMMSMSSGEGDDNLRAMQAMLGDTDAGGEIARFAMRDLANYKNQLSRAVGDDDPETVRRISEGVIDPFVETHGEHLMHWADMLEQSRDTTAQSMARDIRSAVTGTYKNEWGQQGYTVRQSLDDTSPEGIARRAAREAKRLGVDQGVARALVDPNDPMFSAFKQYGDAIVGKRPVSGGQPVQAQGRKVSDAALANFKAAVPFVKEYADRFGGAEAIGGFLAEFDRVFNANNTVSGQALLRDAADGFLAQGGSDSTGYLSSLKELRDHVQTRLAKTSDGNIETRARMHEANTLVGSFIQEALAAGGPVPLDSSSLYGDALVTAVGRISNLSSIYGIDMRDGQSGLSPRIARMALKGLHIAGVDDEGLYDFFRTVTPALDLYMGSDGVPTPKVDSKGNMVTVPADGRLAPVENAVRAAAGRRLWELQQASGTGRPDSILQRLEVDPRWQGELKNAIADELAVSLGSRTAADLVAGDIYLNVLGKGHVTIMDSLLAHSGKVRPDGAPVIPSDIRITAVGPAQTAGDKPVNRGGQPEDETLDKLIAAPEKMVPAVKGDQRSMELVKNYAMAEKKARRKGATDSDRYHAGEALGTLIGFKDEEIDVLSGAMARIAVMVTASPEKVLDKSFRTSGDLALIAGQVREGNPDAILSAALVVEGAKQWWPKRIARARMGDPADPVFKGMISIRDALSSVGLTFNGTDDSGDKALASARAMLSARGDLDKTVFVKSGYLDPQTGAMSANRMLMKMQQNAFIDPMTKTYPSITADKPEEPTPEQAAARRALSMLMPKDSLVGMEQERYREHLRRQGYSDSEAAPLVGAAAGRLAEAYERDGAAGLLQQSSELLQRYARFFPAPPQRGHDGKWYMVDRVDRFPTPLTQEEYDREVQLRTQTLFDVGVAIPPFLFQNAQVTGLRRWTDQQAVLKARIMNEAKAAGTRQGKGTGDDE